MIDFINTKIFKFLILPLTFVGVSLFMWFLFGITNSAIDMSQSYWYLILYVLIFAFWEEVIFRYIIQWWLWSLVQKNTKDKAKLKYLWIMPILFSSFLFTLLHLNPWFSILFLSFFLWIVYNYYNSIILNIYIHMLNNFIALTLLYFYL